MLTLDAKENPVIDEAVISRVVAGERVVICVDGAARLALVSLDDLRELEKTEAEVMAMGDVAGMAARAGRAGLRRKVSVAGHSVAQVSMADFQELEDYDREELSPELAAQIDAEMAAVKAGRVKGYTLAEMKKELGDE